MDNYRKLEKQWSPLLGEVGDMPAIKSSWKRKATAVILENTKRDFISTPAEQRVSMYHDLGIEEMAREEGVLNEDMSSGNLGGPAATTAAGGVLGYDPVMVSMLRRSMPNLMAYDIAGVQPMTAPTGLIFALRSKYGATASSGSTNEALFQEADARYSGVGGLSGFGVSGVPQGGLTSGASTNPWSQSVTGFTWAASFQDARGGTLGGSLPSGRFGLGNFRAMLTGTGELLSLAAGASNVMNRMAFTIDRVAVQARTRALAAEFTTELAQDLKAVHGLDAEAELTNLLTTEILAEQNRELIRTIYFVARTGSQQADLTNYAAGGGVYNLDADSDGRWSAERWRGMYYQIERECNMIAKETRRGKGNFAIVSSDVASALAMGGFLLLSPAINTQLEVDDTGNTFAGILNNRIRIYVDPYSTPGANFFVTGYRGPNQYDAGIFYCPYVPLQMARAVDPNTGQPKIFFKTRYGIVANPFVVNSSGVPDGDSLSFNTNQYYRLTKVEGLHGGLTA